MRRARSALLCGVAFAAALPLAGPAAAQGLGERITDYTVELRVEPSGDVAVVERIAYDFGRNDRHGIYRTIPEQLPYDETYHRVYPIRDVEVETSRGAPDDTETERENGYVVVRVGDPDRTIRGRHTYEISYRVRGAITRFEGHDELYWNAIGAEWDVPVEKSSVTVTTPAGVEEVACFAGPPNSRLECGSARYDGPRAVFGNGRLEPRQAFTIVVALPRGAVASPGPILRHRWTLDRAFSRTPATVGLGALGLLGGLGMVARLLWRRGRDRRYAGQIPGLEPAAGTAVAEEHRPLFGNPEAPIEFSLPDGMRPALVGVLVDESADPLDVSATIVDLAVRRHLAIEELPRKGLFRRRDWRLTRLESPPGDDLLKWEHQLLYYLFKTGETVDVSDLKTTFHEHLEKVQELLYDDVVKRGWFTRRPDQDRGRWFLAGALTTGAGIALTYALARWTTWGLVGLPVALTGLALLAVHKKLPFRTAKGSAALAKVQGFRRFLVTADAEQLRSEERKGIFSRYLPYAVVFGETERWAKAFEKIGLRPEQETYWYHGPSGWSVGDFTDSVGDFSTMAAGTLSATPGGSGSGFGGGGSGGGGGGGGGGSW